MKKILFLFAVLTFTSNCKKLPTAIVNTESNLVDLQNKWDYNRTLFNPHKGWYHHFYDNGNGRYMDKGDDNQIANFPNLHHLYLRLPWSYIEPKEGQFNWAWIDDLVKKWYDTKGIKISICITAKETDLQYATPKWVRDAGAAGLDIVPSAANASWIIKTWEPDYGDPIFLQKLDNFHKACAARYDGKPYIIDIVTGSIGSWGEGHHSFSSDKQYPIDVYKKHFDIYAKHYTKSQLTTGDDWIKWNRTASQIEDLRNYAKAKNFSYRDDSVLVDYWLKTLPVNQASVAAGFLFDDAYLKFPTTIEMEHYYLVKENKNWSLPNGQPNGLQVTLNAIKLIHATFISFHGYIDEWTRDNPVALNMIANRVGYWYFPKNVSAKNSVKVGEELDIKINWLNQGAAPAYNKYKLFIRLSNSANASQMVEYEQVSSNNKTWLPDVPIDENYKITIPVGFEKGTYNIQVCLKTEDKAPKIVDLGLSSNIRTIDGYFTLKQVVVE